MQITDIIKKEDLKEPYDRLSEFLSLDEIIGMEQLYGGRQVKFKRNCEDVKVDYPDLTVLLGTEKAVRVIKTLGGIWVYFPELKRNCTEKIKGLIVSECDGYNFLQLSKKYGYTERHIRNIVSGKVRRRFEVNENQLSLFDDGVVKSL